MKRLWQTLIIIAGLALATTLLYAASGQGNGQALPISQPLVREGTLAVRLAEVLQVVRTANESEAETLLISAGIAPRNGWIADYPVTPDIVGELRSDVSDAADARSIVIEKNEALTAFDNIMSELNLMVREDNSGRYDAPNEAVPDDIEINDYYSYAGPPLVTYYSPPADYAYLYSWVPYPFWWADSWFPGFFVLVDFDRVVIGHKHRERISNHFFNGRDHAFHKVDAATRTLGWNSLNGTTVIGPSPVKSGAATVSTATTKNATGSSGSIAVQPSATGTDGSVAKQPITTTYTSSNGAVRTNMHRRSMLSGASPSGGTKGYVAPSGGGRTFNSPPASRGTFGKALGSWGGGFGGRGWR